MKPIIGFAVLTIAPLFLITNTMAQDTGLYRIKPGDQLNIYVHENLDLSLSPTVLPDGTISYPLVGNLYVQGLTTAGLQNILTDKLKQFIQNPVVVVTILSETLYKVFVMGEVGAPNAYPFEEGRRLTDYLAIAGGLTQEADLKECNIYTANSDTPKRVIDLREIFTENNMALDIVLQPNSTIVIERRSGFIVTEWAEIAHIVSIIVGAATLFYITSR
ncbi:MAG: polysaccharide biosynthesis/export family protein [bacterium]